jgi:hypothetical protein
MFELSSRGSALHAGASPIQAASYGLSGFQNESISIIHEVHTSSALHVEAAFSANRRKGSPVSDTDRHSS